MTFNIRIQGKDYPNPEAMPPDLRQAYEQALKKLPPSAQEKIRTLMAGGTTTDHSPATRTLLTIDGTTYESTDSMPPEVRARYEKALATLGDLGLPKIPAPHSTINIDLPGEPPAATGAPGRGVPTVVLLLLLAGGLFALFLLWSRGHH